MKLLKIIYSDELIVNFIWDLREEGTITETEAGPQMMLIDIYL